MSTYRTLQRVINARPSSDGDGVKIRRIAGPDVMPQIDPFLLLDEIRSEDGADYIGGFPDHPHRGFETITYMIDGAMRHKDHLGNEGVIASGDVQWMTAGRGVIHSEIPVLDLEEGVRVKLIAGSLSQQDTEVNGPVADSSTQPTYLDIELKPGAVWELAVKPDQTVLLLMFSGATTELAAGQMGATGDRPRLG